MRRSVKQYRIHHHRGAPQYPNRAAPAKFFWHFTKNHIADLVTQTVINILECIHIGGEQGKFAFFTLGKGDKAGQLIIKQGAVGKAGQGLIAGQALQILIDLVKLVGEAPKILLRLIEFGLQFRQPRSGYIDRAERILIARGFQTPVSEFLPTTNNTTGHLSAYPTPIEKAFGLILR